MRIIEDYEEGFELFFNRGVFRITYRRDNGETEIVAVSQTKENFEGRDRESPQLPLLVRIAIAYHCIHPLEGRYHVDIRKYKTDEWYSWFRIVE